MSLPLPALLNSLSAALANEVAPALQLLGQPDAPDANYAGGTAGTAALMLALAAADAAHGPQREAAAVAAAQPLLGAAATGRDVRMAALGARLAAGDGAALALMQAEAEAAYAALGLPPPVPVGDAN
jgi:phage-related tail protein